MTSDSPSITEAGFERFADACVAGAWFSQRARHRDMQLRRTFVTGREGKPDPPPLATLMRGGRGGEVRLKLLLSLLWVGAKPPHDVSFPARAWAELLGLSDPGVRGARRVREAIDWLVAHKFLAEEARPGLPTTVILLREDGSGAGYSVPGPAAIRARERGRGLATHRYVRLPHTLWANGWIALLSAPAVAGLLILLAEQRGPVPDRVWLSPHTARDRYALSDQTRYKGFGELSRLGLIERHRIPLGRGPYEVQRTRNAYTLQLERLDELPTPDALTVLQRATRGAPARPTNLSSPE